jgi:hypothetical protein
MDMKFAHVNERPPPPQPRVPPEAVTWCISEFCRKQEELTGDRLQKAHRVKDVEVMPGYVQHKPVCGAAMEHSIDNCAVAPHGWPACRNCAKKAGLSVPAVFFVP